MKEKYMYIIFKVMVYLRKKYGSNNYKKKKTTCASRFHYFSHNDSISGIVTGYKVLDLGENKVLLNNESFRSALAVRFTALAGVLRVFCFYVNLLGFLLK